MIHLRKLVACLLVVLCALYWTRNSSDPLPSPTMVADEDPLISNKHCFCELEGSINDCSCNVDTVDHFNNMKIFPRITSLLVKNYFRFYKVNLRQQCPFWPDDSKCSIRFCQVENCEEHTIPKGIKDDHSEQGVKSPAFKRLSSKLKKWIRASGDRTSSTNPSKSYSTLLIRVWPDPGYCSKWKNFTMSWLQMLQKRDENIDFETVTNDFLLKYTKEGNDPEVDREGCEEEIDFNTALGFLDTSLSDQAHEEFQRWAEHDEAEEDFCILDDIQQDAEYIDLMVNPERYTGYKGDSAHRIWKSIYFENCFGSSREETEPVFTYIPHVDLRNVCLEHRAFYRLISGLHTSINLHLCSKYLLSDSKDFMYPKGVWGPNVDEFKRRFSPETTNNEGPHWLRNLYFVYLVELRALAKAAPYLRREEYYTGISEEDAEVKLAIHDLLAIVESFQSHFDENVLFSNGIGSIKLKQEYKEKFRNITKIMDCVGCDKCKLWGKLQTQGLGTALKILYSEKLNLATENGLWDRPQIEVDPIFRLSRSEIVALFNAFGRLSTSIYEMESFRRFLR